MSLDPTKAFFVVNTTHETDHGKFLAKLKEKITIVTQRSGQPEVPMNYTVEHLQGTLFKLVIDVSALCWKLDFLFYLTNCTGSHKISLPNVQPQRHFLKQIMNSEHNLKISRESDGTVKLENMKIFNHMKEFHCNEPAQRHFEVKFSIAKRIIRPADKKTTWEDLNPTQTKTMNQLASVSEVQWTTKCNNRTSSGYCIALIYWV